MQLKLIVAFIDDQLTDSVIDAARKQGATGATVITGARGEGLRPERSFLGLDLTSSRSIAIFLVAASRARTILETIAAAAGFDDKHGTGVAFELTIDDAVGLTTQLPTILHEIEEEV